MRKYRVSHLLVHLGCDDLDFECSTVCPIRLIGILHTLGKMVERPLKSTQWHEQMGHHV